MFGYKPKKRKKLAIIIGCGRLGAKIAAMMSLSGIEVIVIDKSMKAFRKLPPEYSGFSIEADASDIDVLVNANIEKASHVIAVADNDNVNITIAHIAKDIFNVPTVVARLYDNDKEAIVSENDIQVIYPNKLSLNAFSDLLKEEAQ